MYCGRSVFRPKDSSHDGIENESKKMNKKELALLKYATDAKTEVQQLTQQVYFLIVNA